MVIILQGCYYYVEYLIGRQEGVLYPGPGGLSAAVEGMPCACHDGKAPSSKACQGPEGKQQG